MKEQNGGRPGRRLTRGPRRLFVSADRDRKSTQGPAVRGSAWRMEGHNPYSRDDPPREKDRHPSVGVHAPAGVAPAGHLGRRQAAGRDRQRPRAAGLRGGPRRLLRRRGGGAGRVERGLPERVRPAAPAERRPAGRREGGGLRGGEQPGTPEPAEGGGAGGRRRPHHAPARRPRRRAAAGPLPPRGRDRRPAGDRRPRGHARRRAVRPGAPRRLRGRGPQARRAGAAPVGRRPAAGGALAAEAAASPA